MEDPEDIYEDALKAEELPAGALMTSKIAPAYNGRTSWFAYEELIEEFLDITILDDEKVGPALRSRLTGDAAVYKPLVDRNLLIKMIEKKQLSISNRLFVNSL